MGRKEKKAQQRQAYKAAFKKVKHGHGGRAIRKKEEAALGRQDTRQIWPEKVTYQGMLTGGYLSTMDTLLSNNNHSPLEDIPGLFL